MQRWLIAAAITCVAATGCSKADGEATTTTRRPQQAGQGTNPLITASHLAGVEVAVRPLPDMQSSAWIDNANLLVLVGGSQYRSMATIDNICLALGPLGDTLIVVVNVQDVMATTSAFC